METLVVRLLLAVLALAVSARTRVTVAGQPVPVLWLLAAALVLALAGGVLYLVRSMARDRARLRAWHPWTVAA